MPEQYAPETDQQVRDLLAWAVAEKRRLAIQGSGTKTGFGHRVDADCLLSLHELRGITDYEPAELVMKAKAGTPLAEIEAELAQHGQCLAFEPPYPDKLYPGNNHGLGTIGGVFMGNLSGPRRYVSGAARDHILGVHAVNGRGENYKSGGAVIKNVTGYDLSKLLTGSWGTLSVVTEFCFKVLPRPARTTSLAVSGMGSRQALDLITRLAGSNNAASGLAFIPARTKPAFRDKLDLEDELLLIRFEGSATSLQEQIHAVEAMLPADAIHRQLEDETSAAVWQSLRDVEVFSDTTRIPSLMKLSLPPSAAADVGLFIEQLGGCEWYADAAGGWIWAGICQASSEDKINTIRREVAAVSGSAVLYRAPDTVKRNCGIFSTQPKALAALNSRIKHSFDPENILNPGRLSLD